MSTPSPDLVPLRKNRDYQLLLTGSTISELGNGMMSLAFMLVTMDLTHSAAKAGLVSASYMAGMWMVTLPAGALCDRWNRKFIMVLTALVGAAIMATIPVAQIAGHLTATHLMLVAFIFGGLGCFYTPAEQAALKRIVQPEQMGHALSLNQARSSLGMVVGSPAAAALFGLWRVMPMAINAACYLIASACAAFVRTPVPAPRSEPIRLRGLVEDVIIGMRWVWKARAIRDMVLCGMVLNLGLNGMFSTALLSLQMHGTSAQHLGYMDAAVGIVGIAAALVAPHILRRFPIGLVCVASMCLLMITSWMLPVHLGLLWVAGTLMLAECALAPLNAGIGAYRVHVTPDAMQGRSIAAARFLTMAMMPASSSGAGFLLSAAGRVPAMTAFAVILTVGAAGCLASRHIRSIPRSRDLASVPEVDI